MASESRIRYWCLVVCSSDLMRWMRLQWWRLTYCVFWVLLGFVCVWGCSGIFVVPDDTNNTVVHAIVTGPFETPYEGGFFYFVLNFPDDYPQSPPKVRLMTTAGGTVRFNPNLYADGTVRRRIFALCAVVNVRGGFHLDITIKS